MAPVFEVQKGSGRVLGAAKDRECAVAVERESDHKTHSSRQKEIRTRSKDATRGSWPCY